MSLGAHERARASFGMVGPRELMHSKWESFIGSAGSTAFRWSLIVQGPVPSVFVSILPCSR